MTYTATQVSQIFSVTRESVRRWAVEFADHLSSTANRGDGRQRAFTDSDLEVLALVASEKQAGKRFDEIHAMLSNGQRGSAPAGVSALALSEQPRATALQAKVTQLEAQLSTVLNTNQRLEGRLDEINRQLEATKRELREAYKEIGRLEAGGSSK